MIMLLLMMIIISRLKLSNSRPFCCGLPGLMRSIAMPRRSHHTDSSLRPKKALLLTKGVPLSVRIASGKAEVLKSALKHSASPRPYRGLPELGYPFPRSHSDGHELRPHLPGRAQDQLESRLPSRSPANVGCATYP